MSSTTNPSGAYTVSDADTSYSRSDLERRGTDHADYDIKESKSGFKTSEFLVWALASALVIIAGSVVDNGEGEGAFASCARSRSSAGSPSPTSSRGAWLRSASVTRITDQQ